MEKALIAGMTTIVMIIMLAQVVQAFTPQPQYTCPICGAKFMTYDELYRHFVSKHPAEPIQIISAILELTMVNAPEIAWSIWWTVQIYDAYDYSKCVTVPEDPVLGIMRDLSVTLKYTIPSDFRYPLKMYLVYQDRTYKTLIPLRQSLGLGYESNWGTYDANLVIPQPGKYTIDGELYGSYVVLPA